MDQFINPRYGVSIQESITIDGPRVVYHHTPFMSFIASHQYLSSPRRLAFLNDALT